ncbi:hypothetical protein AB0D60_29240 [Streptomyces sp. NPDC048306]|uniref:hypothetical protein n=1 Tax=Streptomyces sp. NPDC048306 TaxID=3154502 RepID=UPI0033DF2224
MIGTNENPEEQAAIAVAKDGELRLHDLAVRASAIGVRLFRRALLEGPERTAIRHALNDLMYRHVLPADAERIAEKQLDSEIENFRPPGTTAWCRRTVSEYVSPAADLAAAGIDEFRPQDTVAS